MLMVADSHLSSLVWCLCYPDCWFWKFHCHSGPLPLPARRWIQVSPCILRPHSLSNFNAEWQMWMETAGHSCPHEDLPDESAWSSSNNSCSLLWETNWTVCIVTGSSGLIYYITYLLSVQCLTVSVIDMSSCWDNVGIRPVLSQLVYWKFFCQSSHI